MGKGSIFTVQLPLGKEHLRSEEIVYDHLPSAAAASRLEEDTAHYPEAVNILPKKTKLPILLIVEDNPDMRAYMRGYLKRYYQVLEAIHGLEGWEEALRHIPDLIISDVMMPEMDGHELCARLKSDERTSHIPVILLTARVEITDKVKGLETGADDYLVKPFVAEELLVRVKNLISQRIKLRAHYQRELDLTLLRDKVSSADQQFMARINTIIDLHLSEAEYGIHHFAREVGFSHSQLARKLEGLTGLNPSHFIRSRRLLRARQLLEQKSGTISQIAYDCGFNNLSYFSRSFQSPVRPPSFGTH